MFWFRTDRPGLQERPSAPLVPWRRRGEPALREVVVDRLVVGKEGGLDLEWWGPGSVDGGPTVRLTSFEQTLLEPRIKCMKLISDSG